MSDKDAFRGLRLHNTLSRQKEDFVPFDPADVRMYVCGPTVYDFAHIGNARPVIVFDVLFRLLRHLYGEAHVTYVRNITDVDDKINARAAEEHPGLPLNEAIRRVTEETEAQFHSDMGALGALRPTHEPRATEHIEGMKRMIEKLVARGNAYVASDHVLFSVPSMPDYGRLSGRPLDEMLAGARVDVAPYKRDPMDFVLWKPSKPGEPAWASPCGIAAPGRPGWHIECSAMSEAHLGAEFDIHGGGIDLVFPHHENELAQSRCAHGAPLMAKYWMHNGFLQVEGEKMSKSLGNFITVNALLKDWPGEVIRLAMLQTQYRQPIDFTQGGLGEAANTLRRWRRRFAAGEAVAAAEPDAGFLAALEDDLNTPAAIARLHELFQEEAAGLPAAHASLMLLGIDLTRDRAIDRDAVEALIDARKAARAAKNWVDADRLRAEIEAMGVAVMDAKDPATGELVTTWELKR
ncbi:cysteine--tRNA ligase [Faunimonas sp. B44]|uniref:cysteine--tRNA ligase n=1 Tax=Faunimonas sp. B44 TaxID=3461493 RepID=UPI004043B37E